METAIAEGYKQFVVDFGRNCYFQTFNEGENIYIRGDPAEQFYLIKEGCVDFLLPRFDFSVHAIEFMKISDSFFGEYELFEKFKTRRFTAEAASKVEVFVIQKNDFFSYIMGGDPAITRFFADMALKRSRMILNAMKTTNQLIDTTLQEFKIQFMKNPKNRFKLLVGKTVKTDTLVWRDQFKA